jgi:hypothetical protein
LTITGLGTATFEEAIRSAFGLHERFQRQFPHGKLENWETSAYKDFYALELSNRYLTPRRDAPLAEHIPFSKEVDPLGFLEDAVGGDFFHSQENEVQYYACLHDEGKRK